jgi:hypothetical protein
VTTGGELMALDDWLLYISGGGPRFGVDDRGLVFDDTGEISGFCSRAISETIQSL